MSKKHYPTAAELKRYADEQQIVLQRQTYGAGFAGSVINPLRMCGVSVLNHKLRDPGVLHRYHIGPSPTLRRRYGQSFGHGIEAGFEGWCNRPDPKYRPAQRALFLKGRRIGAALWRMVK